MGFNIWQQFLAVLSLCGIKQSWPPGWHRGSCQYCKDNKMITLPPKSCSLMGVDLKPPALSVDDTLLLINWQSQSKAAEIVFLVGFFIASQGTCSFHCGNEWWCWQIAPIFYGWADSFPFSNSWISHEVIWSLYNNKHTPKKRKSVCPRCRMFTCSGHGSIQRCWFWSSFHITFFKPPFVFLLDKTSSELRRVESCRVLMGYQRHPTGGEGRRNPKPFTWPCCTDQHGCRNWDVLLPSRALHNFTDYFPQILCISP